MFKHGEAVKMKETEYYFKVHNFLYYRYDKQLITVISTNLDDEQIAKEYGARIWDRIMGIYDRVAYKGDSYRV